MTAKENKFFAALGAARLRPGSKADLEASLRHAQGDVRQLANLVSDLEDRLDQLSMFSMALWDLLRQKTGLADEELQECIASLAEQRNEQLAAGAQRCPRCDRVMSQLQGRCLYCAP